jgi:hypothetical protein
MKEIVIKLDTEAALLTSPESEEAKLQNLLLNMMSGLLYTDLSQEEKNLLLKNGYKPK